MNKGVKGFVAKLSSHDRGIIILCNMLDGYEDGLYGKEFIRVLLDWWAALYVWRIKSEGLPTAKELEAERLLGTLNMLLFQPWPVGFRAGLARPDFRLACIANAPATDCDIQYLNVQLQQTVFDFFLKPDALSRVVAKGGMPLHREPGFRRKISKVDLAATDFKDRQLLGREREVVFVTPAEGLKKIMSKPKMASMARDVLGLIHQKDSMDLVALSFACPAIEPSKSARPSFADAGGHRRFKALASQASNKADRSWGYTVDLDLFHKSAADIDGLRERVTFPFAFDDMKDICLYGLGTVDGTRGQSANDSDVAFATRLRGKRSAANVKSAIWKLL